MALCCSDSLLLLFWSFSTVVINSEVRSLKITKGAFDWEIRTSILKFGTLDLPLPKKIHLDYSWFGSVAALGSFFSDRFPMCSSSIVFSIRVIVCLLTYCFLNQSNEILRELLFMTLLITDIYSSLYRVWRASQCQCNLTPTHTNTPRNAGHFQHCVLTVG